MTNTRSGSLLIKFHLPTIKSSKVALLLFYLLTSECFWGIGIGEHVKGRSLPKTVWFAENPVSFFRRLCLESNTRGTPSKQNNCNDLPEIFGKTFVTVRPATSARPLAWERLACGKSSRIPNLERIVRKNCFRNVGLGQT